MVMSFVKRAIIATAVIAALTASPVSATGVNAAVDASAEVNFAKVDVAAGAQLYGEASAKTPCPKSTQAAELNQKYAESAPTEDYEKEDGEYIEESEDGSEDKAPVTPAPSSVKPANANPYTLVPAKNGEVEKAPAVTAAPVSVDEDYEEGEEVEEFGSSSKDTEESSSLPETSGEDEHDEEGDEVEGYGASSEDAEESSSGEDEHDDVQYDVAPTDNGDDDYEEVQYSPVETMAAPEDEDDEDSQYALPVQYSAPEEEDDEGDYGADQGYGAIEGEEDEEDAGGYGNDDEEEDETPASSTTPSMTPVSKHDLCA